MQLRFFGWILGICAVLIAAPVHAELLGDTKVPFSADRTVTLGAKTYTGKIYAMPGRQRHEQDLNGLRPVAILRADRSLAWVVLPDLHIYGEFKFPQAVTDLSDRDLLGPALDTETIAGQRTTKYRVEHRGSDGSVVKGFIWRTSDGIVMKLTGTFTSPNGHETNGMLELANLRKGLQSFLGTAG